VAIEEGQWTEKREVTGVSVALATARLNRGVELSGDR
jgi:hypothetical protein